MAREIVGRSEQVPVKLPGALVWELWKRSDAEGLPVAQIIENAIAKKDAPPPPAKTHETHNLIIALVKAGLDDGRIAVEIDRTRGYVADVRRRYGLKPNKRKEDT